MQTLKKILQGTWLGHPLHPAIVHIPTALWPAAVIFDLLSRFGVGGNVMVQTAFYCIAGGLLAALLAVPTGLADFVEIKPEKPARRIGWWHMLLNAVVAVLFAVNLGLRADAFRTPERVSLVQLTLSLVGTLILFVSGYLGGLMAYDHGIGVARMSKKKWRKLAEAGKANVPEP